jgi:hypothetical protein
MDIGVAVPGCALWVTRVDNPDFLCPIGVAGELLVEGVSKYLLGASGGNWRILS